jgi:serine beta-lactamase-like protein LACTB
MSRSLRGACRAGVLILGVTSAHRVVAQDPAARYAQAIAESRQLIRDTMAALRIPGAQIAVIMDGELIWSEGFGLADVEQQVSVTPITRMRIASISKAVTSVGLGLLIQEGKVDLDQPVQRYVPYFPEKSWPVSVRQVAGHLAGIRHYRAGEFESMKPYPTVREGVAIFADDTLLFEPGTRYAYSSYGWNLISAVIEGASGEPFLGFMERRVFGPMGMTRTIPEFPDSIIPWRAHAYVHADSLSSAQNAPYVDNSYKWAGGGFLSTAEDLARLGRNLLDGRVLRRETTELLWTSQVLKDGKPTGYGIGWGTTTDSLGHRRVGHTGGAMGGTSSLIIYPDDRLVLALLVNSDQTFIGALPRIGERFLR